MNTHPFSSKRPVFNQVPDDSQGVVVVLLCHAGRRVLRAFKASLDLLIQLVCCLHFFDQTALLFLKVLDPYLKHRCVILVGPGHCFHSILELVEKNGGRRFNGLERQQAQSVRARQREKARNLMVVVSNHS